MSFKKVLLIFLLVLSLFSFFTSPLAAEGFNLGPVILRPNIYLDMIYDDNYNYKEKDEESAFYLEIEPSLGLSYEKGKNKFSLNVRSPGKYFFETADESGQKKEEKTQFDDTSYSASLEIHLPWRSYLKIYDSFRSTKTSPFLPDSRKETEGIKKRKIDNLDNHARFVFGTSIGDFFKFEGNYRNDIYKHKGEIFNLSNKKVDNLRGMVVFNFFKNDNLLINYNYQTDKYENNPSRDSKLRQYDFGLRHPFKNYLTLSGRISFGNNIREGGKEGLRNFITPESESDTFTWGTTVDYNIMEKTSLSFSLSKTVTDNTQKRTKTTAGSDESTSSKNESFSMFLDFRTSPTDRTDITLSGRRTKNDSSLEFGSNIIYNDIELHIDQKIFGRIYFKFNYAYGFDEKEEWIPKKIISSKGNIISKNIKRDEEDINWRTSGEISFRIFKHGSAGISIRHQERDTKFRSDYIKNVIALNIEISY